MPNKRNVVVVRIAPGAATSELSVNFSSSRVVTLSCYLTVVLDFTLSISIIVISTSSIVVTSL